MLSSGVSASGEDNPSSYAPSAPSRLRGLGRDPASTVNRLNRFGNEGRSSPTPTPASSTTTTAPTGGRRAGSPNLLGRADVYSPTAAGHHSSSRRESVDVAAGNRNGFSRGGGSDDAVGQHRFAPAAATEQRVGVSDRLAYGGGITVATSPSPPPPSSRTNRGAEPYRHTSASYQQRSSYAASAPPYATEYDNQPMPDLQDAAALSDRQRAAKDRAYVSSAGRDAAATSFPVSGRYRGDTGDARRSEAGRTGTGTSYSSTGLTGLRNLGNTCFMNSVVQCLSAASPLREFFAAGDHVYELNAGSKTRGRLASEFHALLGELWDSGGYASPTRFKRAVETFAPSFAGYSQHDAHEFLRFLLDGLHEDLNRITRKPAYRELTDSPRKSLAERAREAWAYHSTWNDSKIYDLFGGMLISTVTCSDCRHVSSSFDPFLDLSIPLPKAVSASSPARRSTYSPYGGRYSSFSSSFSSSYGSAYGGGRSGRSGAAAGYGGGSGAGGQQSCTLQDCLAEFVVAEELDGADSYTCPSCKTARRATKRLAIARLPQILVIHLKRFRFSSYGLGGDKISASVDFPVADTLDMSEYCLAEGGGEATTYRLFAVSNHMGSLRGGHYTAYAIWCCGFEFVLFCFVLCLQRWGCVCSCEKGLKGRGVGTISGGWVGLSALRARSTSFWCLIVTQFATVCDYRAATMADTASTTATGTSSTTRQCGAPAPARSRAPQPTCFSTSVSSKRWNAMVCT